MHCSVCLPPLPSSLPPPRTLLIGSDGGAGLQYYIQDPAFAATDVRFFQEDRKAIVLRHPEAEAHIDGETLLYAPHLEYEVLEASLKYRPAFVFCNDIQNFLDTCVCRSVKYPGCLTD